jgi:hypothetical protein
LPSDSQVISQRCASDSDAIAQRLRSDSDAVAQRWNAYARLLQNNSGAIRKGLPGDFEQSRNVCAVILKRLRSGFDATKRFWFLAIAQRLQSDWDAIAL